MKICLAQLKVNEKAVITSIENIGPIRRRLLDMGLVKGTQVLVIRKAPLGDPMEILIKGYNLSLRKDEANHIFVARIND